MKLLVINIESTPNPDALKFIVDQQLLAKGTRSYANKTMAKDDPLASALFERKHVETIFYMDKFITVSKNADASWSMIMNDLKAIIESLELPDLNTIEISSADPGVEGDALLGKIEDILKARVLPYLANDGGSLEILGMEGHQLKIRYQGACGSCPSSTSGTLNAIQAMLRHTVDQKIEVVTG